MRILKVCFVRFFFGKKNRRQSYLPLIDYSCIQFILILSLSPSLSLFLTFEHFQPLLSLFRRIVFLKKRFASHETTTFLWFSKSLNVSVSSFQCRFRVSFFTEILFSFLSPILCSRFSSSFSPSLSPFFSFFSCYIENTIVLPICLCLYRCKKRTSERGRERENCLNF